MAPVVVSERLTKSFGRHTVVDDVSFEVGSGEVLGLLGPNGSGKTTILRILTGYLQASSGRALIAGFDVVEQGLQARQRIGYVPEDVPLYPSMQVDEFLDFMARLRGQQGKALQVAVDRARDQLSLEPVRKRAISKLSRGYRQRVMIAQALLGQPDLLILDEPTNGLDPKQIIEVRELIRELSDQHTILVTSHILSEIERVADRVAILLDGKLIADQVLEHGQGSKLRLRIRGGQLDQIRALLNSVDGVRKCLSSTQDSDGSTVYVLEVSTLEVAQRLAQAITANNYGLLEMGETRTDLEDLFLNLTAGNTQ